MSAGVRCWECGKFMREDSGMKQACVTQPWVGVLNSNTGFTVGPWHPVHQRCARFRFLPGRPFSSSRECPGTKSAVVRAA